MSILDRICMLLGDGKQQELTDYLGLKKTAFSDWKGGKSNSYRKYLIEIAEFFNVSLDYLVFGKEQPNTENITDDEKELLNYYKELDDISKSSVLGKAEGLAEAARRRKAELKAAAEEKNKPATKAIPLPTPEPDQNEDIDDEDEDDYYIYLDFPDLPVSAGTGVYLHDDYAEQIKVPINDETRRANYALRVKGDSMEPRFYDGDIVLVETQPSVKVGEIGIFIYDGEAYIKEFGEDRLISLNPKYPDKRITDFNIFYCKGLVIGALDKKDILK
ncbi:MAG: helix-turn-helix domain-containing protein [Ruminiclostridium sp.]|nr:helix-turn-helix domain-containing protein [Ruminiclostridium sp.]